MSSTSATLDRIERNPDGIGLKGTLLVASTLTVMAGATISPALPSLREAFITVPNIDFLVRMVLTVPALFIALGAPVAGYIVDRFGRKHLLVASAILYGFAGASGSLVENIWLLLTGRALLGLAVAGVMTTVTTLIADYYDDEERSSFLGIQAAFSGMGGVVFLSLGGVLADIGWRTPFLIYLFSFVLLPFIMTQLYEPHINRDAGVLAATPSVQSIPFGLLAFCYITMTVSQIIFYSVPVQLPFYLEDLLGATAFQSGLAIAALSFNFSIASALFGLFYQRMGNHPAMLLGLTITGTGFILITLASEWLLLGVGLAMGGFGLGLVVPNIITWIASGVPRSLRGRAMGGVTTSLFLGQFISPFIVTPITDQVGDGAVYATLGIFLLIVVAMEFILRGQIRKLTAPLEKE